MISSEDIRSFDNLVSDISDAVLAGYSPARPLARLRTWLQFQARPELDDSSVALLDSALQDLYSNDPAIIRRGLSCAIASLGLSEVMINVRFTAS